MATTAEQLLKAGLLEAICDLEFIGRQSDDGYTRFLAIEAANVAGLYLEQAEKEGK